MSSEFSFQSLMLSVANSIDGVENYAAGCPPQDSKDDRASSSTPPPAMSQPINSISDIIDKSFVEERVSEILQRMKMAKAELQSCEKSVIEKSSPFVSYINLRCILETKKDHLGLQFFGDSEEAAKFEEFVSSSDSFILLNNCAAVAEGKSMHETSKKLYTMSTNALLHEAMSGGDGGGKGRKRKAPGGDKPPQEGESKSPNDRESKRARLQQFGTICRKLVKMSSSTTEAASVFESLTSAALGLPAPCGTVVSDMFRQEDLNWFCVEAYNRGITCSYFGDEKNSEMLLRSSLNLLPLSSREVSEHGDTIRSAYSRSVEAVERKEGADFVACGGNAFGCAMHALFKGVTPSQAPNA